MLNFVGRKNELDTLKWLSEKKVASMVVIKGRRRIGKSRLVQEFAKRSGIKILTFTGLPPTPKTTLISQLDEFAKQMQKELLGPAVKFSDWNDVFWFLADKVQKGRLIIFFDEISWMGAKDPDFMGKIKNGWDLHFKNNPKLLLIICGSISAWIEENILSNTGFVGRISSVIKLEELSLAECNKFWGTYSEQISAYEKFKILSITGGVPRYLEEFRPEQSAEDNIRRICFSREGFLFNEFEQIFNSALVVKSDVYLKVVTNLVDNKTELQRLCDVSEIHTNRTTTKYLDELMQAGFIARDYTWHIKTATVSKLSSYRIKDNYLRFYLKYILPNKDRIFGGFFSYGSIGSLPGWNSIMALQFESLVLNNRMSILKALNISPSEVVFDNPYFQRKTSKQEGCQIDYLIQTRFNCLYVCKIKYKKDAIKSDIIDEMQEKLARVKIPKSFSYRPVLIHVNGVDVEIADSGFFAKIIDFGELLNNP